MMTTMAAASWGASIAFGKRGRWRGTSTLGIAVRWRAPSFAIADSYITPVIYSTFTAFNESTSQGLKT